jgi:hypothetical protein
MRRALRTPALLATLAVLALAVGMGATSWGAPLAKAPSKLVADVKKALKLSKTADRNAKLALADARKARAQSVAGPQGPAGPAGAAGPQGDRGLSGPTGKAGSGLGYAQIEYCDNDNGCSDFPQRGWFSADDANSAGIDNSANFQTNPPPPAGVFCYHDLPFTPHVVVPTIGTVADATGVTVPYLVQGRAGSTEHPLTECPFVAGVDQNKSAAVVVRDLTGATVEPRHDLRIWVLFG